MILNKKASRIKWILYLTFLLKQFIKTVLITFVGVVFTAFVDKISVTYINSIHLITEVQDKIL